MVVDSDAVGADPGRAGDLAGQFIAVSLLFNTLHLVGGVAQELLELVPVAGGALGVWLGMAVSVAACHLLSVWVFCNRDRLYN